MLKPIIFLIVHIIIGLVIICPNQLYSKTTNKFKYPSQIVYKILKGKNIVGSSVYTFSKKGFVYYLTISRFKGFGVNVHDKWSAEINTKNFSLIRSSVTRGNRIIEELKFKENEERGFLGQSVFLHKDLKNNTSPTMTQLASPYRVIDVLSSFVVLTQKVSAQKHDDERFNLFVNQTSYIVECSVKPDIPYKYKNKKIQVSKVTLKYMFENKNTKKTESVDLATFYIYLDQKQGYSFPICVMIELDSNNQYRFVADKYL